MEELQFRVGLEACSQLGTARHRWYKSCPSIHITAFSPGLHFHEAGLFHSMVGSGYQEGQKLCVSYFSCCFKRMWRGEGSLAQSLRRDTVAMTGEVWWQEPEAAGHMLSTGRKQREVVVFSWLFSFLFLYHPCSGWVFSTWLNLPAGSFCRYTQRCVS